MQMSPNQVRHHVKIKSLTGVDPSTLYTLERLQQAETREPAVIIPSGYKKGTINRSICTDAWGPLEKEQHRHCPWIRYFHALTDMIFVAGGWFQAVHCMSTLCCLCTCIQ